MLPLDGAPRRHLPIGLRTNHGCMHRCWDDHSHARYRVRHSPLALAIVRRRWPYRFPNRSGGVTSCGMGLGGGWANGWDGEGSPPRQWWVPTSTQGFASTCFLQTIIAHPGPKAGAPVSTPRLRCSSSGTVAVPSFGGPSNSFSSTSFLPTSSTESLPHQTPTRSTGSVCCADGAPRVECRGKRSAQLPLQCAEDAHLHTRRAATTRFAPRHRRR